MAIRVLSPALLAAATATLAISSPAMAQPVSAASTASTSWSKSEAILGGSSALEAIIAQQRGQVARSVPRPASYSIPLVRALIPSPARISEGVSSGRPDVFGTVALRVAHTPLDARWHRAAGAALVGARGQYATSLGHLTPVERLKLVNRYVNRRVRFTDDQRQFGRADVWSAANDTLQRGRGDCEDYAIAKLQMLRRAGISDRDLYLVIVRDLVRRADHAVLVVRAAGHMYVLDNGTDDILDSETVSDYRPVLTFAATGAWTHGYRVRSAPMVIASGEIDSTGPVIPAADGQRSRSASLLAFNTGFSR